MFYQTHALCANETAGKLMLTFVYTKEYVPILAFQVVWDVADRHRILVFVDVIGDRFHGWTTLRGLEWPKKFTPWKSKTDKRTHLFLPTHPPICQCLSPVLIGLKLCRDRSRNGKYFPDGINFIVMEGLWWPASRACLYWPLCWSLSRRCYSSHLSKYSEPFLLILDLVTVWVW